MNRVPLQEKWRQMKGEVKAQWGKLTNDDVEQINGNLERLVDVVQQRYGYVWERAQREVDAFRARILMRPGRTRTTVAAPQTSVADQWGPDR